MTGPRARLLLIDDVPSSTPASVTTDSLWANTALRNLPTDSYTILRLESTQPFRSNADMEQTLELFESVVWYRGSQTSFPALLSRYQDGIAAYLEAGGKLMVEGLNLVEGTGASGAFRNEFTGRFFGSDGLYKNETPGLPGDSTVAWGIVTGAELRSSVLQDSLRMLGIFNGLRGFAVRDTNYAVIWARAGWLSQPHLYDIPVGVSVPQPSGGRATLVTFPMRVANGFSSAPQVLAKLFAQLGLTGP